MINWTAWKSWQKWNTPDDGEVTLSTHVSTITIKLVRGGSSKTLQWSQPLDLTTQAEADEMFGDDAHPAWWSPTSNQWGDIYGWLFDSEEPWHIVRYNGGEEIINRRDVFNITVTIPQDNS